MTRLDLIKEVATNQPADIAACLCYVFKNGTYGCQACPASADCKDNHEGMLTYLNSECEIGSKEKPSSMQMLVHYIAGINSDRVEVTITNNTEPIFRETYSYGYNASNSRKNAEMAEKDHSDSIKYGWKNPYPLKPYIGDILTDLLNRYGMSRKDIIYSGYYVFPQRPATAQELKKISLILFKDCN